jgi:pSer/pThr/pTyr-binding forkhead associated (FHA) protein
VVIYDAIIDRIQTLLGGRRQGMRLFVSLGGSTVNEVRFDHGPIYIGRQEGSQVFLPDKAVSRQHSVLYTTRDGTWILEDLGSSNKTYLNDVAIHKNEIKNNDTIRIADFNIRVSLDEEDVDINRMVDMEETTLGTPLRKELHTVERSPSSIDAPPIKFPAKQIKFLCQAMDKISSVKSLQELYPVCCELLLAQMKGINVWVGLRKATSGPMDIQGGRKLTTETVQKTELALPSSLDEVLEKNIPMLIHQLPRQIANRGIRSVIISPIMHDHDCHGVFYIENSTEHNHYSLAELDYLLLVSIFTGCYIHRM